jgi:hypothetical protein
VALRGCGDRYPAKCNNTDSNYSPMADFHNVVSLSRDTICLGLVTRICRNDTSAE